MKKSLFTLALICLTLAAGAQIVPAPSPLARTMQMVGLTEIEVEYSSPALKGRDLFGDFVKKGELWRTGANMASKITFGSPVAFAGKEVLAGSYAIFTIPEAEKITVILNSNTEQGGTGSYDEALDVARVSVPLMTGSSNVERMRFSIVDFTDDMAKLEWAWGKYHFHVPIAVATDDMAEAKIAEKLEEIEGNFRFYNQAASYYLESGKDAKQAVAWAKQSVDMKATFWNVHTLAKAYHAAGDMKLAKSTAERSLKMSEEAEYGPYIEMNKKLLAEIK